LKIANNTPVRKIAKKKNQKMVYSFMGISVKKKKKLYGYKYCQSNLSNNLWINGGLAVFSNDFNHFF